MIATFEKIIGYGRQVEQRDVLPHNSRAVDQNLLTAQGWLELYHAPLSE